MEGIKNQALSGALVENPSKGYEEIESRMLALFESIDRFDLSSLTRQQREDAEKFFDVDLINPDEKESITKFVEDQQTTESSRRFFFAGKTIESTAREMVSLKEKLGNYPHESITLGELYVA